MDQPNNITKVLDEANLTKAALSDTVGVKHWEKVADKHAIDATRLQLNNFGSNMCSVFRQNIIDADCGSDCDADAFVLENVLSNTECDSLMAQTEAAGYSFWDTSKEAESDFRCAWTVEMKHTELSELIWKRVQNFINSRLVIGNEQDDPKRWGCEIEGHWEADSINNNLLFARYGSNGHFGPHTDGCTIVDFNYRSFFPLIIYLNNTEEGGETIILKEDQKASIRKDSNGRYISSKEYQIEKVKPKAGRMLCFYYDRMHEGAVVGAHSVKYIIRSDVMYRRKEPLLTSLNDKEAYKLWLLAQQKAETGHLEEASQLFRKCFKLSDSLRNVLKM